MVSHKRILIALVALFALSTASVSAAPDEFFQQSVTGIVRNIDRMYDELAEATGRRADDLLRQDLSRLPGAADKLDSFHDQVPSYSRAQAFKHWLNTRAGREYYDQVQSLVMEHKRRYW
ncbi:uncharacterized protein PFL1_05959 [Pseudozyma flocculosa PF-1]|uniref:Uncharacterized protein n=2 Tax=Pseudozyma flocculosa TaxID=84751 RepID=A0A5C3F365_9BASI|nr:uncharacterized protein PFL1_05959 [Pseudozyma flocculosa PF-1]EPQ26638.1 hypothetical protein PFL1_05959 [Pseudozyma flocculosa PF-1]SPO38366.1 uncharacterized protein PSFLO_03843 [Pseudozyma flocculosa]